MPSGFKNIRNVTTKCWASRAPAGINQQVSTLVRKASISDRVNGRFLINFASGAITGGRGVSGSADVLGLAVSLLRSKRAARRVGSKGLFSFGASRVRDMFEQGKKKCALYNFY